MNDIIYCDRIGGHTLMGVSGAPPFKHGNGFSMISIDDKEYGIVNFYLENLEYLIDEGHITWPIKIKVLKDNYAVIHDERIPHDFYNKYFRGCPKELWPISQQLEHEREIMYGTIKIIHTPIGAIEQIDTSRRNYSLKPRKLSKEWGIEMSKDIICDSKIDIESEIAKALETEILGIKGKVEWNDGIVICPYIPKITIEGN